jgi:hypothetical protein
MRVSLLGGACVLLALGCGISGPEVGSEGEGEGATGGGSSGSGSGPGSGSTGGGSGSTGPGGGGDGASCVVPKVDPQAARPVQIMPSAELASFVGRLPCLEDKALVALLESADTMFYDAGSIIPGYQDSYGNKIDFPVGMRPNSIDPIVIELAVPGGHGQLFEKRGLFHFPFGNPIQVAAGDARVVDFWHAPRGEGAQLLPVAWWWYEPSGWTHRIKWTFPVGTVFGELMFVVRDDGELFPFEVRTRTREIDRWVVDVHRPFPEATDLASALQESGASGVEELVAHLLDPGTLEAASLSATHYVESFETIDGALDVLPGLADNTILETLLLEKGFTSAKGKAWKTSGGLISYAATTDAAFSIVPRKYNAGLVEVSDDRCSRCHQDAGRPFKDYYFNVIAYGELWGEDENFTWHPFETKAFVDQDGDVVSFNDDNRKMRADFVAAGVVAEYDPAKHPASLYQEIDRPWRNYVHF